jgi:hypothetical protein
MLNVADEGSIAMMSSTELEGLSRKFLGKLLVDDERRVPEVMLRGGRETESGEVLSSRVIAVA